MFVDVVTGSGVRSVAIVGTVKNAKTVAMNYLVSELSAQGLT